MAPFSEALKVERSDTRQEVYHGVIDQEWLIGGVPHGGYVLALVLKACIQYQASTLHRDPIHITAHFLRITSVGPFEIRLCVLKAGRGFTNLAANFYQTGELRFTTHAIFGSNAPSTDPNEVRLTLKPPSTYARRIPLTSHPSAATTNAMRPAWKFRPYVKWTDETKTAGSAHVTGIQNPPLTSLDWTSWFQFTDERDSITSSSLAFLVDIFVDLPWLLPKSERPHLKTSWYPTVTMSIEFKSPIPLPSPAHSTHTVGLYSTGRFINDPQGRHDAYVEVWTAPSNIGEGEVVDGWQEQQICLATATQMALCVPMEINHARAKRRAVKL